MQRTACGSAGPRRDGFLLGRLLPVLLAAVALLFSMPAAAARPDIGDALRMPQITLVDGSRMAASSLDDKVVVVMFWATWCPVCASEMPYLEQLYRKQYARGLRVIAVSLDDSVADVRRYWTAGEFTMPVAMRSPELRERFGGIRGTPTFYVLDRASRIHAHHLGRLEPEAFEGMIDALLR